MSEPRAADTGNELKGEQTTNPNARREKQEPEPPKSHESGKHQREEEASGKRRKLIIVAAIAVVLASGAYLIWRVFFAEPKLPESIVALSGRIEGDDSAVAPK